MSPASTLTRTADLCTIVSEAKNFVGYKRGLHRDKIAHDQ